MENENATNSRLGESTFTLHEAVVDAEALRIAHSDRTEKLEPKVMGVLLALAQRHGRVVSRHELGDLVWEGRMVSDDAVTNAVGKLRKSLDDHPCKPRFIETIPKRGYRLIPEPIAQMPTSRGVPKAGILACPWCIVTAVLVLVSVIAWVL